MPAPIFKEMILPLTLDQAEMFSQLDHNSMDYAWNLEQWLNLSRKQYYLCALMSDGKILAFSLYQLGPDQAHLLKIVTEGSFKQQGMASKLLQANIMTFKTRGITSIYLEVAVNNEVALKFYQKFGFSHLTVKKSFYSDGQSANAMSLLFE